MTLHFVILTQTPNWTRNILAVLRTGKWMETETTYFFTWDIDFSLLTTIVHFANKYGNCLFFSFGITILNCQARIYLFFYCPGNYFTIWKFEFQLYIIHGQVEFRATNLSFIKDSFPHSLAKVK